MIPSFILIFFIETSIILKQNDINVKDCQFKTDFKNEIYIHWTILAKKSEMLMLKRKSSKIEIEVEGNSPTLP